MNFKINPIIIIIGTRPEGIKLVPVYFALKKMGLPVKICATFQHTNLLQEVFDLFDIRPDFSFNIMQVNQDLFHITQAVLEKCKQLFLVQEPQLIIVQGDTTSAMTAALAAFYLKIPVAHIEAGLRTGNLYAPFPEELNRQFISLVAKYNFAPTSNAVQNLKQAGIDEKKIYLVGNTVVDTLALVVKLTQKNTFKISPEVVKLCNNFNDKLVVFTMHRRESFGDNMLRVFNAIKEFADQNPAVRFVYPVHPNPQVQLAIEQANIQTCANIFLIKALPYHELIYILSRASCVVTDSGGIQEEAASLGKPVVLLRNETDRPETVIAGLAWLVGYNKAKIQQYLKHALGLVATNQNTGIYGDGQSANKIAQILKQEIVMIKVSVIGLGYIGLPTAILLAESGFNVHGYDIDEHKINKIRQGIAVIEEQELGVRLASVAAQANFLVSMQLCAANVFVIAVPTPINHDKTADLGCVWSAVKQLVLVLQPGACVIIESTVPVGTTRKIAQYLYESTGLVLGQELFVAFSPERVIPGKIFYELVHNERLVGGVDQKSSNVAASFYANFVQGQITQTDADTAEMVKLVENSSRDVQIAFANQVASMAQAAGINPLAVINFANKHPRVNILTPGCGVGGHCIAVDPWFLIESFPLQTKLLQAARNVNDSKPLEVLAQIASQVARLQKSLNKQVIELAVLGVTYKPDVDDLRNSPAFFIAQELQKWSNVQLVVVEPYVEIAILSRHFKLVVNTQDQLLLKPDLVVALVAHTQFKSKKDDLFNDVNMLDFCAIKEFMGA